jgi:hypothetical protein
MTELKDIVSITGKPGLYRVIARTNRGLIVESLDEKKTRIPVSATQQIALLDDITIYTTSEENLSLKEVLQKMEEYGKEKSLPGQKDDTNTLKSFFSEIAPEHDPERVYVSDMKKILKWHEILAANPQPAAETPEESGETEANNE